MTSYNKRGTRRKLYHDWITVDAL